MSRYKTYLISELYQLCMADENIRVLLRTNSQLFQFAVVEDFDMHFVGILDFKVEFSATLLLT